MTTEIKTNLQKAKEAIGGDPNVREVAEKCEVFLEETMEYERFLLLFSMPSKVRLSVYADGVKIGDTIACSNVSDMAIMDAHTREYREMLQNDRKRVLYSFLNEVV